MLYLESIFSRDNHVKVLSSLFTRLPEFHPCCDKSSSVVSLRDSVGTCHCKQSACLSSTHAVMSSSVGSHHCTQSEQALSLMVVRNSSSSCWNSSRLSIREGFLCLTWPGKIMPFKTIGLVFRFLLATYRRVPVAATSLYFLYHTWERPNDGCGLSETTLPLNVFVV